MFTSYFCFYGVFMLCQQCCEIGYHSKQKKEVITNSKNVYNTFEYNLLQFPAEMTISGSKTPTTLIPFHTNYDYYDVMTSKMFIIVHNLQTKTF